MSPKKGDAPKRGRSPDDAEAQSSPSPRHKHHRFDPSGADENEDQNSPQKQIAAGSDAMDIGPQAADPDEDPPFETRALFKDVERDGDETMKLIADNATFPACSDGGSASSGSVPVVGAIPAAANTTGAAIPTGCTALLGGMALDVLPPSGGIVPPAPVLDAGEIIVISAFLDKVGDRIAAAVAEKGRSMQLSHGKLRDILDELVGISGIQISNSSSRLSPRALALLRELIETVEMHLEMEEDDMQATEDAVGAFMEEFDNALGQGEGPHKDKEDDGAGPGAGEEAGPTRPFQG